MNWLFTLVPMMKTLINAPERSTLCKDSVPDHVMSTMVSARKRRSTNMPTPFVGMSRRSNEYSPQLLFWLLLVSSFFIIRNSLLIDFILLDSKFGSRMDILRTFDTNVFAPISYTHATHSVPCTPPAGRCASPLKFFQLFMTLKNEL